VADDFIQHMPLDELSRFVRDLCRQFGVPDEEVDRLGRMSRAEFDQYLRDLEEKFRRWSDEGGADG
jgi:hypothetical protein